MDDVQNLQAAMTLAEKIDSVLSQDRPLAVLPDGPLSTIELRARVFALAQAVLNCAAQGTCVGVYSSSDRHVFAAVTTCLRLGYPFLICDPEASVDETSALLFNAGATVLICDGAVASAISQNTELSILDASQTDTELKILPPIKPVSTAVLVATSGTTSRPKIVELSLANLIAQFSIFAEVYGFDRDTRALNLLPLHHVDGLIRGPLLALWFDCVLLRTRKFSVDQAPQILNDLGDHRATHLITVPAMLRILHRIFKPESHKLPPCFHFVLCSADYLDTELWNTVERDLGVPVVNAYGLSELVCDALIAGPDDASRIIGTIGVARGVEAQVVDSKGEAVADGTTGELAINGGTVMRGYLNDPEATADVLKDGVFRTGDLVQRREDGLFEYMGRQKNVVVVGGVTIHPEAVAESLSGIPGVAETYVFGNNTPKGEVLIAAVCPSPDTQLEAETVFAACRTRLAPERQPSKIVIMPELPRRASGKVDQAVIIDTAMAKTDSKSVEEISAECFGASVDDISIESTPFNTPGWDSLAHMEFIEMLEDCFDFTMLPEDVAGLMSVGDAIEIVERETG